MWVELFQFLKVHEITAVSHTCVPKSHHPSLLLPSGASLPHSSLPYPHPSFRPSAPPFQSRYSGKFTSRRLFALDTFTANPFAVPVITFFFNCSSALELFWRWSASRFSSSMTAVRHLPPIWSLTPDCLGWLQRLLKRAPSCLDDCNCKGLRILLTNSLQKLHNKFCTRKKH